MIISKFSFVKIAPINYYYWKNLGYKIESTGGRKGKNTGQRIKVRISDLLPGSNIDVSCRCDLCGLKYIQRFCRNTNFCYVCRKSLGMKGNTLGKKNKGKKLPNMSGSNHHNWNPNKTEFKKYAYKVRRITEENYEKYKDVINPDNLPRTLCGVDNGYQLDHIVSIKWGYTHGVNPKALGGVGNLQMLPWQENREKFC